MSFYHGNLLRKAHKLCYKNWALSLATVHIGWKGKSLVCREKIVGVANIVTDSWAVGSHSKIVARILLCFPGYWTIAPLNSNWLKLVILFFCFLFELCNFCSKIVFYYPFKSKIVIYSGTLLRKLQRKICKQTSICCLM